MKKEDAKFVTWMKRSLGVHATDEIKRKDIRQKHVLKVAEFLSPAADRLIAFLSERADEDRESFHMSADTPDFIESGLGEITRCAQIIICRVSGSQGREIVLCEHGIVVFPHMKLCKERLAMTPGQLQPA